MTPILKFVYSASPVPQNDFAIVSVSSNINPKHLYWRLFFSKFLTLINCVCIAFEKWMVNAKRLMIFEK
jgi:hypothetical protein